MRVGIFAVGRMKAGPERELARRYLERFEATGRPLGLVYAGTTEVREGRAHDQAGRQGEESALLRRWRDEGRTLVLLDESGRELSSPALARRLGDWRDGGVSDCIFAIGGPDGHDPELRSEADLVLSFGRLTWPHQLARVMLAEQLYRATTILAGHPYHRD